MADTAELPKNQLNTEPTTAPEITSPKSPKDQVVEGMRSKADETLAIIFPADPESVGSSFFDQFKTHKDYDAYALQVRKEKGDDYLFKLDKTYDKYCASKEKEAVKSKKPKTRPEPKQSKRKPRAKEEPKKASQPKKQAKRTPENKSERPKSNIIGKIEQIQDFEKLRKVAEKYAEKELVRLKLNGDDWIAHVHSKANNKEFAQGVCQALNGCRKNLLKKQGAKTPEVKMESEKPSISPEEIAEKLLIASGLEESDVESEEAHTRRINELQAEKAKEDLKSTIAEYVNKIGESMSFRNESKTGVYDLCDQFIEEVDIEGSMLRHVNNINYVEFNRKNNWAKSLALAVHEKIKEIKAYRKLRDRYKAVKDADNGFWRKVGGADFAFQLELKDGEGSDIANIYNMVALKGTPPPPFKNGEIACADIKDDFLDWAVENVSNGPKKRDNRKPQEKRDRKRKQGNGKRQRGTRK